GTGFDRQGADSPSDASPGARPDAFSDDPRALEVAKRRYLVRRFWDGAKGFWGRRGDRLAWVLSGLVLALILLNLAAQYGINVWNRVIFDALEARDSRTVLFLSALFGPLAAASIACRFANVYRRMRAQHPS